MDFEKFVGFLFSGLFLVLGWLWNIQRNDIKELKQSDIELRNSTKKLEDHFEETSKNCQKELFEKINLDYNNLLEKISKNELKLTGNYVKADDLKETEKRLESLISAVFKKLDKIEEKVDGKVDKSERQETRYREILDNFVFEIGKQLKKE